MFTQWPLSAAWSSAPRVPQCCSTAHWRAKKLMFIESDTLKCILMINIFTGIYISFTGPQYFHRNRYTARQLRQLHWWHDNIHLFSWPFPLAWRSPSCLECALSRDSLDSHGFWILDFFLKMWNHIILGIWDLCVVKGKKYRKNQ